MDESQAPEAALPNDYDFKTLSRGISVDMRPEAILQRLQIMSDLSRACQVLGQAKRLGRTAEISPAENRDDDHFP